MTDKFDVAVIGGGPAGLAAAVAASKHGASVLLIERETRLGGILKQCIHDGFGVIRYGEKLTGPQYAFKEIQALKKTSVKSMLQAFVTNIERKGGRFLLTIVSSEGISEIDTGSLVLATGCRERTAKQAAIFGTRPSGVLTAGSAQYYTNIMGMMPARRCVILGSGDIGLIMARRLTLEGAEVLGVYEAKNSPGGLARNIEQCLNDFDIPLHLEHTVTRLIGADRLKAVEVCKVDRNMAPIPGTDKIIECDALILSIGLIPENELAQMLGIPLDPQTRAPVCDSNNMTTVDGVFSCGNALKISDLADDVSASGELAGRSAAYFALGKSCPEDKPLGSASYADSHTASRAAPNFSDTAGRKTMYCIICPTGCLLEVSMPTVQSSLEIEGNKCKKGIDFAIKEMTNPTRTLTTTVRTTFPGTPVLPVRTDGEIPKNKIMQAMQELSHVVVSTKLNCGDTIIHNIAETGVRVISTSYIP